MLSTVTVVFNHEEIKKDLQKITKIKPFVNKYDWEEINFPSKKDDCKNFETNCETIALNVFLLKKEKISCFVSKYNSHRKKQVIPLMISNRNMQS